MIEYKKNLNLIPNMLKMYLDRYYHDAKNSTFLIRQQSEDNEDTFSFTYKSIMEYLVARRIVTIISNCDKEALIKYSAQIKTPETFAFIDYITDVDWAIKPHIIPELALNLGDTKASYHDHLDRSNFLNETIEYAKTKSKDSNPQCNPKIANLVNILYSVSNFAKFSYKQITNNYSNPELDFSNCNLSGLRIPHANLSYANLSHADLTYANLSYANLSHADLSGTILYNADLSGGNLSGAKLCNSKLMNTDLTKCDLSGADLSLANRSVGRDLINYEPSCSVNLSNSDLTNVNLETADLSSAFILNLIAFEGVKVNSESDFSSSLITDKGFHEILKKFTKKLPELFHSRQKLAGRVVDTCTTSKSEGEELLRISKLPDI